MIEPSLLTYPARPVNGGHLKYALPKVGRWSCEPKYNGWRGILHVPTGAMWNRHGKRLSIAGEFAKAVAILKRCPFEWLDVEALSRRHALGRGSLIVLDCPDAVFPGVPDYASRSDLLHSGIIGAGLGQCLEIEPTIRNSQSAIQDNAIYLPPIYPWEERDQLWQWLQDANMALGCDFYEGLVAKRKDSLYPVQHNNPDQTTPTWMKHRFIK
jgi:hypothetical protein